MKKQIFNIALFAAMITMLFTPNTLFGQKEPSIVNHEISPHWYYFEKEDGTTAMTVKDFVPIFKSEFGLSENDELEIKDVTYLNEMVSEKKANDKTRCTKFQHYYNGYKVESSVIITFDESDTITIVTGNIVGDLNIDTSNPISQSTALDLALDAVTGFFIWQDSVLMSGFCMDDKGDFDSISYNRFLPKGELCLARKFGDEFISNNFRFVWKFSVNTTTAEYRVLVDAKTGEVYDVVEITKDGYAKGKVQTLYDGYITNEMETYNEIVHYGWKLQNSNGNRTVLNGVNIVSITNNWIDSSQAPATTAHWIIGQLADFYWTKYLNNTVSVDTYINAGVPNYYNASYNHSSNAITIGELGNNWLSTIDVIGHELTHRLVHLSADLEYIGESGALNESFADIFGTLAERFIRTNHGRSWNWTIGEDAFTIRSMSNPHLYSQPDYYQGQYWVNPLSGDDNGGVHTNSGVQNKWFYNLSQSIGPDKAGLIAYYMLHLYLTPTSNYHDALVASVFAAENLYGRCSDERNAVITAWQSVGVSSDNLLPCTINGGGEGGNRFADKDTPNDSMLYMDVFPNPVSEIVNIEFSDELTEGILEIYNITGIKFDEIQVHDKTVSISMNHLPDGLYFINAKVDGRSVHNAKIIVNKTNKK